LQDQGPNRHKLRRHNGRGGERCGKIASDLTDEEWALIEPMMPAQNRIGRPRKTELREIVNALL
jgi:hypothetical protein